MDTPILLLVDDAEDMHLLVRAQLRRLGLKVRIAPAYDGLEALTLVQDPNIALIISDVNMPRMDGTEFLRRMRSTGLTTPFVLTGGQLSAATDTRGADVVVGKDDLLSHLEGFIERWMPSAMPPEHDSVSPSR